MTSETVRPETDHERLCRTNGFTPAQWNEKMRRIGRTLWHLAGFIAGIACGCWVCGHAGLALAFLIVSVATAVFVAVTPGEFDPVTGQRVRKAKTNGHKVHA